MKIVLRLVLAFGILVSASRAADRETELKELQAQFPAAPEPINDKTDPLITECFQRYKAVVEKLTLESLGPELLKMRQRLERDISYYERQRDLARQPNNQDSSRLKTKLRPYVARLESFQRGRDRR